MKDDLDMKENEPRPKREQWGSKAEFFLASLGYSVGMGSLTRFPYMVMRNGGGAFLIPFVIAMLLVGIPLFYMEVILGQFSGKSPLTMWAISPAFKGIGYSMTLLTLVATSYYMPFTWSMVYLVASCNSDVPWRGCDNEWNTEHCAERNVTTSNATYYDGSTTTANASFRISTPAEEYWNEFVLDITRDGLADIGELKWYLVLAHFSTYFLVFLCVIKGTASAGKVVYVTATLPYLLLTVLLVRGLTLEGSLVGIEYFLKPDWDQLANYNVWLEAAIQVVFQLGPAWGSLITMSRYNEFHHKVYYEAFVIPIGNLLTALYGGLALFSVLGFMSVKYNVPVKQFAASGPGLAFVAYPEAIAELPISPLWSIVFFLMLISVAIDSQLAFFETIVSGICDMFPKIHRWKMYVSAALAIGLFLVGLPLCTQGGMYIYVILDWYGAVLSFTLIAFLESVVIAYIYGLRRFYGDAKLMFGSPPNPVIGVVWFLVTPAAMAVLAFIGLWNLSEPTYEYTNYTYPRWAIGVGWLIAISSFLPVPITLLYTLIKNGCDLKKSFKPTEDWLPVKEELQEAYRNRWYRKATNALSSYQFPDDEDFFGDFFTCKKGARVEQVHNVRSYDISVEPSPPPYAVGNVWPNYAGATNNVIIEQSTAL